MDPASRYRTLSQARVALSRLRVLIAEDDDDIRQLLRWVLADDGFEVSEARDGAELLQLIMRPRSASHDHPLPDLIVSDIMMPRQTGLEALQRLRAAGVDVPVIIVTAYGSPATVREAERLGATAVFHKPLDIDDLRTAVLHFSTR